MRNRDPVHRVKRRLFYRFSDTSDRFLQLAMRLILCTPVYSKHLLFVCRDFILSDRCMYMCVRVIVCGSMLIFLRMYEYNLLTGRVINPRFVLTKVVAM